MLNITNFIQWGGWKLISNDTVNNWPLDAQVPLQTHTQYEIHSKV